jgi:hypothetical protein
MFEGSVFQIPVINPSVFPFMEIRKDETFPFQASGAPEIDQIADWNSGNSHVVEQLSLVFRCHT